MNTESKTNKNKPLADLIINIAIPSLILMKMSSEDRLGPVIGLVVALAFPTGYFLWEWATAKKTNFISILGIINVLLTGGIALLELDPLWVAIKEAAVPAVIGIVVLGSLKTPFPLVRKMIYNPSVIDTEKVDQALEERGTKTEFEKLLTNTSYLLSLSFFLSSALNFGLARYVVRTYPSVDQVAFNEELGQMTALSYPVIVAPSTIVLGITLWLLIRGIKNLTGLSLEAVFRADTSGKQG